MPRAYAGTRGGRRVRYTPTPDPALQATAAAAYRLDLAAPDDSCCEGPTDPPEPRRPLATPIGLDRVPLVTRTCASVRLQGTPRIGESVLVRVIVSMLAGLGWLVLCLACTVLAAAGLFLTTAGVLRSFDAVRRLIGRTARQ